MSIRNTILLSTTFLVAITFGFAQKTYAVEPITSKQCNVFTFDASASHDPDNEFLSFFWDFGDGTTSTEPVVDHTYTKSGTYDVTLSIADNSGLECSTAISTQKVKANIPPTINIEGLESKVCAGDFLNLDASTSFANSQKPLSYYWNFGDGTSSTNPTASKAYENGGNYKISLNVDDQSGTICSSKTIENIVQVNEEPIANAGDDEILVCVGDERNRSVSFDASGSTDANNDSLQYFWDFGDGRKSTGMRVTHNYRQLGNYDVKLIVDDSAGMKCSKSVDFVTVRLNKAPKANAGKDIEACPNDEIVFDGSKSYAHKKGTLSGMWSFGDGNTAEGLKATHSYSKPGKYQARLTVENELNAMCPASVDTKTVVINASPSVVIRNQKAVCLGHTVHFDASSAADPDGDKLQYYWSFGDGTVLRGGSKVNHTYKTGGDYKISVIVDDGRGNLCSTATATSIVKVNTQPKAHSGANLTCCMDKPTTFDASQSSDPDGDRLTYIWDFGDGTTSQGEVVSHTFSQSGSYNVTLTVDDNSGTSCSKATAGFVATANSKPVPIMKIR